MELKPSWRRKLYSHSCKILAKGQTNPEVLLKELQKSAAHEDAQLIKKKPKPIKAPLLRDRYKDMVDKLIQQYAQEEHIPISMPRIVRKNQYMNYRIVDPEEVDKLPTRRQFKSEQRQDDFPTQLLQFGKQEKGISNEQPEPFASSERNIHNPKQISHQKLPTVHRPKVSRENSFLKKEELKAFKRKIFGDEYESSTADEKLLEKKYLEKYAKSAAQM